MSDTFPRTACPRCGELAINPVKLNNGGYECPNCYYGSGEEYLTRDDFRLVFRSDERQRVLDEVRTLLNDLEDELIEEIGEANARAKDPTDVYPFEARKMAVREANNKRDILDEVRRRLGESGLDE